VRSRRVTSRSAPRESSGARPPRLAVVVSRYNATITDRLLKGAEAEWASRYPRRAAPTVVDAPGTYELPVLALAAAESGRYDGVVALGCLIRGQTRHDRHIADAVARGLIDVSLRTGVPVTFGVLTVHDAKQAEARAGGSKGNKGADAMSAAIEAVESVRAARAGRARRTGRVRPDKARGKG
jgi:6,7-dimethyl-8-ribityllumazine synthase